MAPPKSQVFNRRHVAECLLPDLAAGADITNYHVFRAPYDIVVKALRYVPVVASAGVDGANTLVVTVKRNNTGTAIGTLTKTAQTVQGAEETGFGTLDATTSKVSEGDEITCDITQGATADSGLARLVVEYEYAER